MAQPANNMNNLTTLIKRLEAATSRLEDIASSAATFDQTGAAAANGVQAPAASSTAGSAPSAPLPSAASHTKETQQPQEDTPQSIEDFDTLLNGDVRTWSDLSGAIGGPVGEQAQEVVKAFQEQRTFLYIATKAKKPEMGGSAFMDLIKPISDHMSKVDEIRQKNRASPQKDQLAMLADGVGALGWITMERSPKPAEFVTDTFGGAQMYGNRVLKESKDKDASQTEWVQAYYKLNRSLVTYIKQHHLTGVQWNLQGVDAAEALKQQKAGAVNGASKAAPAPSGGAPPPPPPPLPPPDFASGPPPPPPPPAGTAKAAPDMGAVFNQLNQGENVTKGLKKVDASQMTHKNPSLRTGSSVPERSDSTSSRGKSPAPPGKKPKPESMRTKKPPRKELDGNKWIVENFDSPSEVIEIPAEINHSILITRCTKTTIRITGKGNAISIDNSARTSLVVDSLVSSVDVIKCPNFALQILETVPTVLLDQVDGAQLYLSKDSLSTEIFTSKSSSVNVNLPPEDEDGDYKECPAPEQFRSFVRNGQLVTEIVEHAG